MTEFNKVVKVATILRNNINKVMPGDLGGECGNASSILVKVLQHFGVKSHFYSGDYYVPGAKHGSGHCWMQYKNKIIDITATQFGQTDRVFIHPTNTELYSGYKSTDHSNYLMSYNSVYKKIYDDTVAQIAAQGIFPEFHRFPNGDIRKIYREGYKPSSGTYAAVGPRCGQLRGKDQKIIRITNDPKSVLPKPNHPSHKYVRIHLKDA